jgi:hypothetical protein
MTVLINNYDLEYQRVRLIGYLITELLWLNLAKINYLLPNLLFR